MRLDERRSPHTAFAFRLMTLSVVAAAILTPAVGACADQSSVADTGASHDDATALKFLIAGVRNEIEKRRSGIGKFRGTFRYEQSGAPEKALHGEVHGLVAIEAGKVRFDITRPDIVVNPKSAAPVAPGSNRVLATLIPGISTKKYANDGLLTSAWHSDNGILGIGRSTSRAVPPETDYLDIRGPTLFDPVSLGRGTSLDEILSGIEGVSKKFQVRVTGVDGPQWTAEWRNSSDDHWITRVVLVVDVAHGFTPVEYRCETIAKGEGEKSDQWIVEWRNRTSWQAFDGAYFPSHHESRDERGPFSTIERIQTLDFEWSNVNQDVDDELFSYTSFDLPAHIGIQDSSTGVPRWIKKPAGSQSAEGSKFGIWPVMAVVTAVLFVLCIVALRLIRTRD